MTRRRGAALAAAAAGLLAVAPGSVGTAQAATARSATAACYYGSIQAADRAVGAIQNTNRVGQKLDVVIPVRNLDAAARSGAFMDVDLDALGKNKAVPPTIWWRLDKGPWRLIHFTWAAPPVKGTDPQWHSPDLRLGSFAAHQVRTLVLSTSFGSRSTYGLYSGWEAFTTPGCDDMLQGFGTFAVSYRITSAQ